MKKKFAVLTSGWTVDYVNSCLEGMKEACSASNADLYVFCCYKYMETSGESNVSGFAIYRLIDFSDYDGIIIMPNLFNDDEEVERIRQKIVESKVPAISIGQKLKGIHFVNSYNYEICKDLVKHLVQCHDVQKFAFIGGPKDNSGTTPILCALKDALAENGLLLSDDDVYENSEWSFNKACEQAKIIFSKEEIPQAVVCINDASAMAAISEAVKKGFRVPDDVKVVGVEDSYVSSKVIPSITTINTNARKIGARAISILLSDSEKSTAFAPEKTENPNSSHNLHHIIEENVLGTPIYRQSCGCQKIVSEEQIFFSQTYTSMIDKEQRFSSQLRHLEDAFIRYETLGELGRQLQSFFQKRHFFEGENFSIMINKNSLNSMQDERPSENLEKPFDSQMQSIVSLKDGIAVHRELIQTRNLFPTSLKSEDPSLYLFLPIYNQKYIYGYYVSKDYVGLLENKGAYNWIRNFGGMLEKYRQTSVYKITSERYEILSTHDALSGLYNREGLNTVGVRFFNDSRKNHQEISVIFIDINDMKFINDRYGHLHGDLAVKTVAESIKNSIPLSYIAIRYGGDEFVIIGEKNNSNYSAKIKRELKAKVKKMELPYEITVSSGTKSFSSYQEISLEEAIREVDKVMYKAKKIYHRQQEKTI